MYRALTQEPVKRAIKHAGRAVTVERKIYLNAIVISLHIGDISDKLGGWNASGMDISVVFWDMKVK
jgi:hypothetical protein